MKMTAQIVPDSYLVDYAFGGKDDNQKVYESLMNPVLDLSLKGGLGSIFAYGQTGSGKTFTI